MPILILAGLLFPPLLFLALGGLVSNSAEKSRAEYDKRKRRVQRRVGRVRRRAHVSPRDIRYRNKITQLQRQLKQSKQANQQLQRGVERQVNEHKNTARFYDRVLLGIIRLCNKRQRLIFSVQEIRAYANSARGSKIGFTPWVPKKGFKPNRWSLD